MSSLIVSEEDKKMEAEETPFENVLDYINRVLSAVLPIPLILINLLVIWLSIYKVRPSLSRSFSLHMSIPSLAYSFYLLVWWILSFLNLDQDFSFRTKLNNVSFMDYFTDYVYWWCTYQYRMLAILIIVLTYLSFARPMFYQKVSQDWQILILFALAHIASILVGFAATKTVNRLALKYFENNTNEAIHMPITPLEVVSGCIDFFPFC